MGKNETPSVLMDSGESEYKKNRMLLMSTLVQFYGHILFLWLWSDA
jgi:hypothetical protein